MEVTHDLCDALDVIIYNAGMIADDDENEKALSAVEQWLELARETLNREVRPWTWKN